MLYVFDVDGTLSFDGKKISTHIKDSILKLEQEGNSVSFASARPIRDLIPIIPEFSSDHLLIGGNGSIVKKIDNEIEVVKSIDSDSFTFIKGIISDYSLNYIVDDSWNYSLNVDKNNIIYRQLDPDILAENVDINSIINPIKVILINIPDSNFNDILNIINHNGNLNGIKHSGEKNIDITAADINKYSTLRKYCTEPYYCFGNDSNDYEIIKHAEKSVWVENTDKNLPKDLGLSPDFVCSSNSIDVAKAIDLICGERLN